MVALELGFGALVIVWLALVAGPAHRLVLEASLATALVAVLLHLLRGREGAAARRAHYVVRYGFVLWAYLATARLVPALGRPLRDGTLLAWDRALWSETPALRFDLAGHPALAEVFSAAYLTYQPYLHLALLWALVSPVERAERLARPVFTTLILGYLGYLLVPAVGPAFSVPAFVAAPLAEGPFARLNLDIVKNGGAVYDVFPSLHTAVTLVLLHHDYRFVPWRFRLMAPVAVALIVSTMLLRLHYAVDVLAGGFLAVGVIVFWELRRRKESSLTT